MRGSEVQEALQSIRVVGIDKVHYCLRQQGFALSKLQLVGFAGCDREHPSQERVCANTTPVLVEPANGWQPPAGQVVYDAELQFGWQGAEVVLRLRHPGLSRWLHRCTGCLADILAALVAAHFLGCVSSIGVFGCSGTLGRGDDGDGQGVCEREEEVGSSGRKLVAQSTYPDDQRCGSK